MLIYHYCRQEAAEKIIWDNTIMFTNPSKFNDPFDADLDLLTFNLDEASQEVWDEIEDLKKTKPLITLQERYPTIPVNYLLDNNPALLEESYRDSQKQKLERSSVACFSLRHDNTLMWSHYADKHYGVVLGFSLDVQPILIDGDNGLSMDLVSYVDDLHESFNYLKDKTSGIKRLFLTKSSDWSYEKEFRLILFNKEGIQKFNPIFLRCIIFGLRFTENEIQKFKALSAAKGMSHLEFFQMKKTNFRLEKVKI